MVGGRWDRTPESIILSGRQGEDPSLGSEGGRLGLLMATGRDPQSLVLDHLKFVQV